MKILELIGIKHKSFIELSKNNQNHVGTFHAGALFIFAENASGEYLKELFPELKDKIIPLLRSSCVKYKKSAIGKIIANPNLSDEEQKRFKIQFEKKSRATIEVEVILKDEDNDVVMIGSFNWFIQMI